MPTNTIETLRKHTFGVELETTGLERPLVAAALGRLFGTTPVHIGRHLDNWVVRMPDGRKWTVERDGSVTEPNAEVVSPVCSWDDLEMVQRVAKALAAAGATTDESCGIHIHIGLGDHTPRTLRNLVNLVNAKEELLTQALGITDYRRGLWCRPVEPRFLGHLNRDRPTTFDDFAALWYRYSFDPERDHDAHRAETNWHSFAATHYECSRYHLLNLHAAFSTERPAHTIEFRAFNGTLDDRAIRAYIQLCLAMSQKALDSKTCSPDRPDTDNPAYTFRCWLLQLGMNGPEFAVAREVLLRRMPGNAAWRNGDPSNRRGH